jgi:malate dehydrogenase (oxaloacetate-decarboxylating)
MTLENLPRNATDQPAALAMRLHPFYKGKVQIMPKCAIRDARDFAIWYTPGVAAPCRAIHDRPELVYDHTNKGNSIAVISDGTRVLGLGDIGPEAGLPVMEGKSLLFKYLGGVDAVPLCLATKDRDELIRIVQILEPSFGGINLEDISQPKCFYVLEQLRDRLQIPVWHDDQQGTATVVLAGLINALKVVSKTLDKVRIALVGMGAANVATYRLLCAVGVSPSAIVACDSSGTLVRGREDLKRQQEYYREKWQVCQESNDEQVTGGTAAALRGADVCIAFSTPGPGVIQPEWIRTMAPGAIVFACANPVPEIWPWQAKEAGARVVATGRCDLPNQVNNSLGFPAIFRGVLDVRASRITDEMAIAAARELAQFAEAQTLSDEHIVPGMDDWTVFPQVAAATAMKAIEQGVARVAMTREEVYQSAFARIQQARDAAQLLVAQGIIALPCRDPVATVDSALIAPREPST